MATPPDPAPASPPPAAAHTARHVRRALERALAALEEAAARVRAGADDEAVHDLRVASRRLTARLDFWRPLLRRRRARRARRRLRSLRRRLGAVRELEVALVVLRGLARDLPAPGPEALALVIASLEARLGEARPAAAGSASHRRLARIRRAVERAARDVEMRADAVHDLDARIAAEIVARRDASHAKLAAALLGRDDAVLHAARIAAKRWRYGLECARDRAKEPADAGDATPAPARAPDANLRRLRALQESLGTVQDVAVIRAMLEAEAGRLVAAGQPDAAAALKAAFERLEVIRERAIETASEIAPELEAPRD